MNSSVLRGSDKKKIIIGKVVRVRTGVGGDMVRYSTCVLGNVWVRIYRVLNVCYILCWRV